VVNIVTASAQPAVMKADYRHRLLLTGPKPSVKGGSRADGDELSVVMFLSTQSDHLEIRLNEDVGCHASNQ
jgi:hypothetical protein